MVANNRSSDAIIPMHRSSLDWRYITSCCTCWRSHVFDCSNWWTASLDQKEPSSLPAADYQGENSICDNKIWPLHLSQMNNLTRAPRSAITGIGWYTLHRPPPNFFFFRYLKCFETLYRCCQWRNWSHGDQRRLAHTGGKGSLCIPKRMNFRKISEISEISSHF